MLAVKKGGTGHYAIHLTLTVISRVLAEKGDSNSLQSFNQPCNKRL